MQGMYEAYGNLVEFRIVYINEAHAADRKWAVPYAKEKQLLEHIVFALKQTETWPEEFASSGQEPELERPAEAEK